MVKRANHIRAVTESDKPKRPAKPQTLSEAVESGDYLEILRAQRRDIVSALPEERGPAKAALHRQLALISKEIQALEQQAAVAAKEAGEGGDGSVPDETWDAQAL